MENETNIKETNEKRRASRCCSDDDDDDDQQSWNRIKGSDKIQKVHEKMKRKKEWEKRARASLQRIHCCIHFLV